MSRHETRWARAILVVSVAMVVCVVATGCESWFGSKTATPLPPIEATAEPTAPASPTDIAPATAVPPTPEEPVGGDYPYPIESPSVDDLPAYPEAYPGE
jgi:hypothetical protein